MAAKMRLFGNRKADIASLLSRLVMGRNMSAHTFVRTFSSNDGKSENDMKDALESKDEVNVPQESQEEAPLDHHYDDEESEKMFVDTTTNFRKVEPSNWERRVLMYGSRYDSVDDIPPEVRLSILNPTLDRIRVYIQIYIIIFLVITMITIMVCGKMDMKKNEAFLLRHSDGLWEASEKKYGDMRIETKKKP